MRTPDIPICAALALIIAVTGSNAIKCYNCSTFYDSRCTDPFNSFSDGIIDCSLVPVPDHLKDMGIESATLCRKTNQKVNGQVRIIRGCGYITDEHDNRECMKRSGTHGVQILYCSCTTDLCNSSVKMFSHPQIVVVILVAALCSYTYQLIQSQL